MAWLCRWLIAAGAAIAPAACRDDWAREWRAELWHEARRREASGARAFRDLDLVFRCAGALAHALWLRKEEWRLAVLLQDLRYALRALRARPGFAAVAILTIALGIGATAAVFGVVHGVLLAPLPYRQPDRLVQIWETNPPRRWTHEVVAPANLLDWKARARAFEDIAFYVGSDGKGPGVEDLTLSGGGDPERVRAMTVSANFFDVLGTAPALGRTFRPDESARGRTAVVVLSDAFWRRRFGGDRGLAGRRIDLNGAAHEVAGVMPPDFHLPGADVDAWVPMLFDEARFRQMRRAHWFRVIARLRPGVTLDQARDEMTRIAADLERQYPETNTQMGVGLGPLHEWLVGDLRGALLGLLGAVALVLLVACTNVAGLLLARATARRREVAIRTALGAGRLRLVRQLLTESFVLAGAGAVFGVLLANGAIGLLRRFGPEGVPRLDRAGIDLPVLIFVTVVAAATALLFGLAPAWQGSRSSSDALKDGARGATAAGARLRRLLIVGEVTLSVVLLVGAGLLVRSFDRLRQVDPGMDASRALAFRISLPEQRYDDDEQVASFYTRLTGQLRGVPGVRAAGASVRLALEGRTWTGDLFVEGKPEVWGRELRHKPVTPGYLEAAGLRLLRGRDFSGADTAASDPVVLVNETLVRQFFGAADPVVGQRLAFGRPSANTRWRTIVGVVADEKQDGLAAEVRPEVYQPHTQDPRHTMSIVVRTEVDPASMIAAIRREVAAVDPAVAIYEVRTLEEVVARSLAGERFAMLAMGVFAVVALVLAMVGLYGVVAFAVSERRREIGVRLALGARQADVLQMVVWDGVRLVLVGLAAGLACAVALGRAMAAFLFGVPPADPIVLAGVAALLGAAAVTAAFLPARRASRIDPAISLRQEL